MGTSGHIQERKWGELAKGLALLLGLSLTLRLPDLVAGTVPTDPAGYLQHPFRTYYLFSLDLFVLVSLLAIVPFRDGPSRMRALVAGSILFLLAYRTYDALIVSMLHRSPIFYADASHIVGTIHLLANASLPWRHVLGLLAGLALFGGLLWTLPGRLTTLHRGLASPMGRRGILAAQVVVWPLIVFAIVGDRGSYLWRGTYQSTCLSTTECLVRNVGASADLKQQVADRQTAAGDSAYAEYWSLDWEEPPSLYVVMIESYGSVLAAPESPVPFDRFMARTADSLRTAGWHAATARSEAPVFGGLSWLSAATLFLGSPVGHQPTFEVLQPELPRIPHLAQLLQHQGYETGTLQPPVRPRPGLSTGNPYGFDHTFYLQDLDYHGPEVGWGIVPDQYSLAVAHDQFVEEAEAPFFLFFETVTPHGPWTTPPPPVVDDPRASFKAPSATNPSVRSVEGRTHERAAWSDTLSQVGRLFRHVRYDWRVLGNYLRSKARPNSLVVVVGDHQPYFAESMSFATPVHVLSRDEGLIRRFAEAGFGPGLRPSSTATRTHHSGLYSLLVRVLTAHDRGTEQESSASLPSYRPQGIERIGRLPDRP